MTPTIRPAAPEDWPALADLRSAAFDWPGEPDVHLPGMWVIEDDAGVRGCARLESEGQWFGGRVVPTGIVSSVAVAPEARGQGLGSQLLRELLAEADALGLCALTLYPSAMRPYRRAGFELAGAHVSLSLDAAELPEGGIGGVTRLTDADLPALMACYDRIAADQNGPIARSERWWRTRVLASNPPTPRESPDVFAYVLREDADVRGAVVLRQVPTGAASYDLHVVCRDLTWETPDAACALLGLLAGGRPGVASMEWPGSLDDPLGLILASKPAVRESSPWMSRILDPVRALATRGYAPDIDAELAFGVEDAFQPSWTRNLRVRIQDGAAEVDIGGIPAPEASIDVGALSAMLAGGLDPFIAARLGRLRPGRVGPGAFRALVPPGSSWIGDLF